MTWAVAIGAVLLGYLVKGVTGFGSVLVAMPLLVTVLPPAEAMLTISAADLVGGSTLAWRARDLVRWRVLAAILPPLVLGQWAGTELLEVLDVATARRLLGAVVGVMAVALFWRPVRPEGAHDRDDAERATGLGWAVVAGLGSGLMSGVVGAPGPPAVAWTRRFLGDRSGRALLLWVFVPSSVALVGMLLAKGLATPSSLGLAAACVPGALIGGWLGGRLAEVLSPATFGRVVAGVLFGAAVALVVGS